MNTRILTLLGTTQLVYDGQFWITTWKMSKTLYHWVLLLCSFRLWNTHLYFTTRATVRFLHSWAGSPWQARRVPILHYTRQRTGAQAGWRKNQWQFVRQSCVVCWMCGLAHSTITFVYFVRFWNHFIASDESCLQYRNSSIVSERCSNKKCLQCELWD